MEQKSVRNKTWTDLAFHFSKTILEDKGGRAVLMIWGFGAVTSFAAGCYMHMKEAENKKKGGAQAKQQLKEKVNRESLIKEWTEILKIPFDGLFKPATIHLFGYTGLLLIRIVLTIKIATLAGTLGKMIGSREFTRMFQLQAVFGLYCVPAAIVNALLHFESHKLSLAIRESLVKHVHTKYLDNNLTYYKLSNLNRNRTDVDQRVSNDITRFSREITVLYGNLLKPCLEIVVISRALAKLMGFRQLVGFFLYFAISAVWLKFCMPPFARMTSLTQKLEGDFRTHHNRIITRSEEIAFYGGANREKEIVNDSFRGLKTVLNKHYLLQCATSILDSYVIKYGGTMFAYSMLIPAVYLGFNDLDKKPAIEVMEYYLTATQLFVALGTACKLLVLSHKQLQGVSGLTSRVYELLQVLKNPITTVEHGNTITQANNNITEGDEIVFRDVDIISPTGQLLAKNLNFEVKKGTNVLISGPNGAGKSSLFRLLGGLWPLHSGRLVRPPRSQLFYVPQQPYLVPGTLRDQITYPVHVSNTREDTKLLELMEAVGLSYLVTREGGLDTVKDWFDVLSGGEKQRVVMARLFYHKPQFGILDECTSAVSVDVEGSIYEKCKEMGITIFTVSHRPQLMHHHDFMLRLEGNEGRWQWTDLSEKKKEEQEQGQMKYYSIEEGTD
eukprot:TRINITY_DN241_c0_g1_i1.p1 TRINITY_DN241_c0_g1~~TRINITY_DN241_c0_g1_i1.p1  ORF type:complete len:669 (+),score=158.34 TRINITY_DN241_c0_g1_i1:80-2086(+)